MLDETDDSVNILLVDDQPAKLLSYEVILGELGERLIKASSATEALEHLLKTEIAILLVDVCMPDLDGFELAAMVRDHPRFRRTAIIFISAVQISDLDHLRGYEMGAVDYVPVPVQPDVLRAKVRVFAELYRTTLKLERLNQELERRVAERTAALELSNARLQESENRRTLALAAGKMGSWEWNCHTDECIWDEGEYRIFGVDPHTFQVTQENVAKFIHPEDWPRLRHAIFDVSQNANSYNVEFRVCRPDGETRWCIGSAAASRDTGEVRRISGVTVDITDRKRAEDRLMLLAREVDHRAKNTLAVVQSVLRLTKATTLNDYMEAVDGRVRALASAHNLLSQARWEGADLVRLIDEEISPFRSRGVNEINVTGQQISLAPATAQTFALVIHELVTNAAKYGALSRDDGQVSVSWKRSDEMLILLWEECRGPLVNAPKSFGFGAKVIGDAIRNQLQGEVSFDWRSTGLRCEIRIPLGDSTIAYRDMECPQRTDARAVESRIPPSNSIMLVEDEPLIAMMLEDMISGIGHSIVGPFSRISDALASLETTKLSGAVLDLNLNGELTYPLADALRERGVPLIFISGYDSAAVDARYSSVPLLRKPFDKKSLVNTFTSVIPTKTEASQ